MKNTLNVLQKIIPDEMTTLQKRYKILKGIDKNQPVGRRNLAQLLNISEKTIRNEVDFLKAIEYIEVSSLGMSISKQGIQILSELDVIMHTLKGLTSLQEHLKRSLQCQQVIIVPGNTDEDDLVKIDIGKAAADMFVTKLHHNSVVAVAGGSSVYHVIHAMRSLQKSYEDVLVLPARGSLRSSMEYQANSLAAALANQIGAKYELLHIPDNLSRKALDSVKNEPDIQKTINKILTANIIIFGIGNAKDMAARRNLPETVYGFLTRKEAIGEALGYYFNKNGEVVYSSRSIGIKLEQMTKQAYPIAVAGGSSKAESILAVKQFFRKGCLVIDEGAANEILRLLH